MHSTWALKHSMALQAWVCAQAHTGLIWRKWWLVHSKSRRYILCRCRQKQMLICLWLTLDRRMDKQQQQQQNSQFLNKKNMLIFFLSYMRSTRRLWLLSLEICLIFINNMRRQTFYGNGLLFWTSTYCWTATLCMKSVRCSVARKETNMKGTERICEIENTSSAGVTRL